MGQYYITKALVNPAGKSEYLTQENIPNDILIAEWIEFGNFGDKIVDLRGAQLYHRSYDKNGTTTGEQRIFEFRNERLFGWDSIRIHTGKGEDYKGGKILHLFLNRYAFIWNITFGDCVLLRMNYGVVLDKACFTPEPPEDQVIYRVDGTTQLSSIDIENKLANVGP